MKQQTPLWPLAVSRMMIGVLWLFSLRWKLPPDFMPAKGNGLYDWLLLEVAHPAFGFYATFIESIVLPNFIFFAWVVFLTELFVGLSLLTGTLTRLGAFVGGLMSLNLLIGLLEVPHEWPWSYMMMAVFHGLFFIAGAGRVLGVDAIIRNRVNDASKVLWLT